MRVHRTCTRKAVTQEFRNVAALQSLVVSEPSLSLTSWSVDHGEFQTRIIGRAGTSKEVQASSDLRQWTTVATLTNFTGQSVFSINSGQSAQQFFRALDK